MQTETTNNNDHGNVAIDDYASIVAPAGTDGIRGTNYGTGTVTIIAEAGATIDAGRYGIEAFAYDGGDVSVTNHATVIGSTAAIDAMTTSTGTVGIGICRHLIGNITSDNATFTNELPADWSLYATSVFTGTSTLANAGLIYRDVTSVISGLSRFTYIST